ncbi:MAG: histidine kinase [Methanobacteriota archaeon]|nr:MAG: histidine kinase [Euryarchaeota archaeon]
MELTRLESATDAIIAATTDRDGALREIAQLLEARVEHYDWVGFYLAEGRELVLGPFVGAPTEHVRIPFGCGVCGQVAESGETLVVPDVATEANYLSCGSTVQSEVVIPIHADGEFVLAHARPFLAGRGGIPAAALHAAGAALERNLISRGRSA